MSPEMLTLVAAVLVYDLALEIWDRSSAAEEMDAGAPGRRAGPPLDSRRLRSWTRLEKDMLGRGKTY
jgi:hypothetical protein